MQRASMIIWIEWFRCIWSRCRASPNGKISCWRWHSCSHQMCSVNGTLTWRRKRTKKGFFKKIDESHHQNGDLNRFETPWTRYPSYSNHKHKWYAISLVSRMWNASRLLQYLKQYRKKIYRHPKCVTSHTRLRGWKSLLKIESPTVYFCSNGGIVCLRRIFEPIHTRS